MINDWQKNQEKQDSDKQSLLTSHGILPKHIAIIMDGNGRWAIERNLPRAAGHQQGIESVRDIVKASSQLGIGYLTVYAFSMENWKRPHMEISILMSLLKQYLINEIDELDANNVRLCAIGKLNALPKPVQKILSKAIERTAKNTGLTLTLALSYSGRWDIIRAVQMIALDARRGNLSPEDINEELFSTYLLTSHMPEPDLLIRTSGEMRLSNYLLWESAYSEIYITNLLWPDFRRTDLYDALENYMNRERRYGMTSQQMNIENTKASQSQDSYLQRILSTFSPKS
ncbi:isoprenyl transferase [Chlorobiota bacterium]|nr:isoprenyl transferase [Chlorobiota bacterium]